MHSFPDRYGPDVLVHKQQRRVIPEVPAEPDLVVEDPASGFCGVVVRIAEGTVVLEDRHGRQRVFPLRPAGFLLNGQLITLTRPIRKPESNTNRSASGSVRVAGLTARTAAASRIWVEGIHDAELIERIWGHDLRVEGIAVEPLHGIDELPTRVAEFGPSLQRRLGILVDHLVPGSKEAHIVASVSQSNVLITGHPYVDIWQAVRPESIRISQWPQIPRGIDWKVGVCQHLGWSDPTEGWRKILAEVTSFRDIESALIGAVERLIDFVTMQPKEHRV